MSTTPSNQPSASSSSSSSATTASSGDVDAYGRKRVVNEQQQQPSTADDHQQQQQMFMSFQQQQQQQVPAGYRFSSAAQQLSGFSLDAEVTTSNNNALMMMTQQLQQQQMNQQINVPDLVMDSMVVPRGVPFRLRLYLSGEWRRKYGFEVEDISRVLSSRIKVCKEGTAEELPACGICCSSTPLVSVAASSPAVFGPLAMGDTECFTCDNCVAHCASSAEHLGGRVSLVIDTLPELGFISSAPFSLIEAATPSVNPMMSMMQQFQQQQQQQQQQGPPMLAAGVAPPPAKRQQTIPANTMSSQQQAALTAMALALGSSGGGGGVGNAATAAVGSNMSPGAVNSMLTSPVASQTAPLQAQMQAMAQQMAAAAVAAGMGAASSGGATAAGGIAGGARLPDAKVVVRVWSTKLEKNVLEMLMEDYRHVHLSKLPGVIDFSFKIAPGLAITFTSYTSVETAKEGLSLEQKYMQNEPDKNCLNANLEQQGLVGCICACACW